MIRILTSLVAVFTVTSIQAQSIVRETPKLVIGITIDQLRGDYLELFQSSFSERGFKRLLNDGLVYQNITFDFPGVDDASAIATIYTGTTPFYHGIVGNKKYIASKQQEALAFSDDGYIGYYTQDKLSPLALKTSTITDELKVASKGTSDVYSFAPQAPQALASAGRNANCAFWVDDYFGKWASSTYYKDFYWAVDQENKANSTYASRAWGMRWIPLQNSYKAFPYTQSAGTFYHDLGGDKNTYILFKQTPIVNENVVDIATKVLTKAELGRRICPDFLALTFYAGNYAGVADYSVEIQDTYARLDKEIEKLLDEVDKSVGLKNVLIFVTSTGYYNSYQESYNNPNAKENIFYSNRCEALLNMYLMAIYGKEQWVDKFYNSQIYLNRKLIEDKKISLSEIQQKAAEFVSEFSGVQDVYTSHQIKHGEWNPIMEYYKNGYTKENSGDLFVEIQPGYKTIDEKTGNNNQIKSSAIVSPVIFFGNGIKASRVKRTIKATEIAPTVSYIMRIRSPNAAKEQALSELL